MRYPNPICHVTGLVTDVRELKRRDGVVFAHSIDVRTEPNGGMLSITADVEEFQPADLVVLEDDKLHTFEVALSARKDGRESVDRSYVRARLGAILPAPFLETV